MGCVESKRAATALQEKSKSSTSSCECRPAESNAQGVSGVPEVLKSVGVGQAMHRRMGSRKKKKKALIAEDNLQFAVVNDQQEYTAIDRQLQRSEPQLPHDPSFGASTIDEVEIHNRLSHASLASTTTKASTSEPSSTSRSLTSEEEVDLLRLFTTEELVERYRLATKVGQLGVWDWFTSTNKLYWNKFMFDMYELDPAEFDHSYGSFERIVHPDDVQRVNEFVAECLRKRIDFHTQFRLLTRSKTVKYIDAHGKLTVDPKTKEPIRLTGINIDLTQRVLAERKAVEEKVRADALNERAEIAEKNKEKNVRFVGNLCHELRNPMVGISGNLSFAGDHVISLSKLIAEASRIMREIPGGSDCQPPETDRARKGLDNLSEVEVSEGGSSSGENSNSNGDEQNPVAKVLSLMKTMSERCVDLSGCIKDAEMAAAYQKTVLDDSLTLAKIDSGKMEICIEKCDPVVLVQKCSSILRSYADSKGLHMRSLGVDQRHLAQVLVSLGVSAEDPIVEKLKAKVPPRTPITDGGERGEEDDVVLSVVGDCYRITHTIINLLSNAIKFTEKGGTIELSTTIEPYEKERFLSPNGTSKHHRDHPIVEQDLISRFNAVLCFSVKDNGIGIDKVRAESIFHRFEQGHREISTSYGGSGLGLAICKELAEDVFGDLSVSSDVGRGSTFTLMMPTVLLNVRVSGKELVFCEESQLSNVCELTSEPRFASIFASQQGEQLQKGVAASVEAEESGLSPRSASVKRRRLSQAEAKESEEPSATPPLLLIVEDNPMNQRVLQRFLQKLGVKFIPAFDGEEAVRIFSEKNGEFDLILMDVRMPNMDGLAATKYIRGLESGMPSEHRRVPILALSGNADEKDKEEARLAGMDGYMTKPYSLKELRTSIQNFALCRYQKKLEK